MTRLLSLLCCQLAMAFAAQASPGSLGPAVGEPAPEASIRSDTGETLALSDAIGGMPTVLIFYRGGWCPFCTVHLEALGKVESELVEAGYQLVAISPDRPEKLRARPSHQGLSYTLLSDSEMHASRALGIAFKVDDALVGKYKNEYGIDIEEDSGQTHHLLPHPAVFIVDRAGVIRFSHVNPDYKVRLDPAEVVAAARAALQ